jgi:predicted O-methyltransferase YrrM
MTQDAMSARLPFSETPDALPLEDWIRELYAYEPFLAMGHAQSLDDLNLGLGWIYYGLARARKPRRSVVIGSWRGFVPLVLARALDDNASGGEIVFIDPSLVDDFWADPARVRAHLDRFGGSRIRHLRTTTQEFVTTEAFRRLGEVDLLYVDGYHTREQAKFDHESFASLLGPDAIALFHDSVRPRLSKMYGEGRHYTHSVHLYMDELRASGAYDVFDLALSSGVTLVQRRTDGSAGTQTPQPGSA